MAVAVVMVMMGGGGSGWADMIIMGRSRAVFRVASVCHSACGSRMQYRAPEMVDLYMNRRVDERADIWV